MAVLSMALLLMTLSGCEQKEWQKARRERTIEAYQAYLKKYPQGEHEQQAWRMIDHLSFAQAYKQKNPEALRQYLHDFPQGKFADNARTNIKKLYRVKADQLTPEQMAKAAITVDTSMGAFTFSLDPFKAPIACRNIIYLAWINFYDGLLVTPVIDGKMVRMGDPLENGLGGPGYMIPAEINSNQHARGAVSMWRLPVDPDTAGSQFFICLQDIPEIDGHFTVFGRVESGMDVLDDIGAVETTGAHGQPPWKPLQTITLQSVKVSGIELEWKPAQVNQEGTMKSNQPREDGK